MAADNANKRTGASDQVNIRETLTGCQHLKDASIHSLLVRERLGRGWKVSGRLYAEVLAMVPEELPDRHRVTLRGSVTRVLRVDRGGTSVCWVTERWSCSLAVAVSWTQSLAFWASSCSTLVLVAFIVCSMRSSRSINELIVARRGCMKFGIWSVFSA
jgi:hypothetical protein